MHYRVSSWSACPHKTVYPIVANDSYFVSLCICSFRNYLAQKESRQKRRKQFCLYIMTTNQLVIFSLKSYCRKVDEETGKNWVNTDREKVSEDSSNSRSSLFQKPMGNVWISSMIWSQWLWLWSDAPILLRQLFLRTLSFSACLISNADAHQLDDFIPIRTDEGESHALQLFSFSLHAIQPISPDW